MTAAYILCLAVGCDVAVSCIQPVVKLLIVAVPQETQRRPSPGCSSQCPAEPQLAAAAVSQPR